MQKITIPGPGEPLPVKMSGLSVAVILAPTFANIEDAPKLSFNQVSERYPITSGSVYPYGSCGFESLVIEGTAASQGVTVYLAALDVCGEFKVNWGAENIKALAGNTFTKPMDGTVKGLSDLELQNAAGDLPKAVYLAAAGDDIFYRWNDGGGTGPGGLNSDYILKAPTKHGQAKIIVNAAPAADETFNIEILGVPVAVSALSTDTTAQIATNINDAINTDSILSDIVTASVNSSTVTVTEDEPETVEEGHNITHTATDTDLDTGVFYGSRDKQIDPVEILGIDFILNVQFVGDSGNLIVTTRY